MLTLPKNVLKIIDTLEEAGFEAYAVGGCVRDLLLKRTPQDFDITTNAKPKEIKALFKRTVDTGIEHGTVTVLIGKEQYEVTTYRIDGIYEDGRHPTEVCFSEDLYEDLKRRDFTINALAYHPERGLVDAFSGQEDLVSGVIRCVGDAKERFEEDALRILRAYRFAAQLGFSIDDKTRKEASSHADALQKISAERIREELTKLLCSAHPEWLRELYKDGITAVIMPEFDACMEMPQDTPYHLYSVGEHTIRTVMAVPPSPILRWTMFLHDFGKVESKFTDEEGNDHFRGHAALSTKMAKLVLERLRFSNEEIRKITTLVYYHDLRPVAEETPVRRAMAEIGTDLFDDYLLVQKADADAKNPEMMQRTYLRLEGVEKLKEEILRKEQCLKISDLAINGKDLIAEGIGPGKEIGFILDSALLAVIEDPAMNDRELLLLYARQVHATYLKQTPKL